MDEGFSPVLQWVHSGERSCSSAYFSMSIQRLVVIVVASSHSTFYICTVTILDESITNHV